MVNITLLNSKVLLEDIEKENTTDSGFILPEKDKEERVREARVVAVGSGIRGEDGKRIPVDVSVGDKVVYEYSSYGTKEIIIDKKTYNIVSEADIIGIIK